MAVFCGRELGCLGAGVRISLGTPFAYKTANTLADLFSGDDGLLEVRLRSMNSDDFIVDLCETLILFARPYETH
jgi:hypothetical protein